MDGNEKIKVIQLRRKYFEQNFPEIIGCDYRRDINYKLPNTCPSCGFPTLEKRCSWEICNICNWEDDGQDDLDADEICSGPNGYHSLNSHRIEFFDELTELLNEVENIELKRNFEMLEKFIKSNETDTKKIKTLLDDIFMK